MSDFFFARSQMALGVGAIVLLPSLAFLFHIFKGKESRAGGGHGLAIPK